MSLEVSIRRARTADVPVIRSLVDAYSQDRILLSKATVTLYEDVQELWVAEHDGAVVGCGALHVLWDDLAEVRTLAAAPSVRGRGVGHQLLQRLIATARDLGVDVAMIERPALPVGVATVATEGDAEEWLLSRGSGAG